MQCKIVLMYVIIRRFIILIFPILELGNFFKHFMLRTLNNVEIERKKKQDILLSVLFRLLPVLSG
jgi:hypothetical protein